MLLAAVTVVLLAPYAYWIGYRYGVRRDISATSALAYPDPKAWELVRNAPMVAEELHPKWLLAMAAFFFLFFLGLSEIAWGWTSVYHVGFGKIGDAGSAIAFTIVIGAALRPAGLKIDPPAPVF